MKGKSLLPLYLFLLNRGQCKLTSPAGHLVSLLAGLPWNIVKEVFGGVSLNEATFSLALGLVCGRYKSAGEPPSEPDLALISNFDFAFLKGLVDLGYVTQGMSKRAAELFEDMLRDIYKRRGYFLVFGPVVVAFWQSTGHYEVLKVDEKEESYETIKLRISLKYTSSANQSGWVEGVIDGKLAVENAFTGELRVFPWGERTQMFKSVVYILDGDGEWYANLF